MEILKDKGLCKINGRLEDVRTELSIVSETLNALIAALINDNIPSKNMEFAFIGARNSIDRIHDEVEGITDDIIEVSKTIRSSLSSLSTLE